MFFWAIRKRFEVECLEGAELFIHCAADLLSVPPVKMGVCILLELLELLVFDGAEGMSSKDFQG